MNRNSNTEDCSLYEHVHARIHFLLNMPFWVHMRINIRN